MKRRGLWATMAVALLFGNLAHAGKSPSPKPDQALVSAVERVKLADIICKGTGDKCHRLAWIAVIPKSPKEVPFANWIVATITRVGTKIDIEIYDTTDYEVYWFPAGSRQLEGIWGAGRTAVNAAPLSLFETDQQRQYEHNAARDVHEALLQCIAADKAAEVEKRKAQESAVRANTF